MDSCGVYGICGWLRELLGAKQTYLNTFRLTACGAFCTASAAALVCAIAPMLSALLYEFRVGFRLTSVVEGSGLADDACPP